jgi:tetratricopeptide (TPR) repeat protein
MALFGWPHTSVPDALERAFDLAAKFDRRQAFGPILWGLCVHYWTRSEFEPTLYWLDKLETIADEVEDSELSAVRDMTAGCQYFWQAEYQRARGYTTHLRGTYKKKAHAHIVSYCNHDPLVFSLHWAGSLLEWITGYPDRSLELAEEAVVLARRIGHPFNSAFALTAGNECLAERGETKRLLQYCDEADAIIEQEALGEFARNMMSNNWRGRALILQGEFDSGYAFTTRSNEFWKAVGGRICNGLFWSSESLALHGTGRQDDAMLLIDQAIDYCRVTGDCWMEPELLRIKGGFLLSKDKQQPDNAENAFTKAFEMAREYGAKSWELRAAISLAEFWRSRDRESEARNLITPVYEWFSEGFDTPDLRAAKSILEDLS